MKASSQFFAIAPRAPNSLATFFDLPETDKTCVTLRIAIARRNEPVRASQLKTGNRENRLPDIFSTVFGFQREKQSTHGDMPLTCAVKHFARLQGSAGIPQ